MPRKPKTAPPAAPQQDQDQDQALTLSQLWDGQDAGKVSYGVYSIYKTPEGGMHIAYRPHDCEEDLHLPVPAMMMQMLLAASEGKGPMARLRSMAMARMGG